MKKAILLIITLLYQLTFCSEPVENNDLNFEFNEFMQELEEKQTKDSIAILQKEKRIEEKEKRIEEKEKRIEEKEKRIEEKEKRIEEKDTIRKQFGKDISYLGNLRLNLNKKKATISDIIKLEQIIIFFRDNEEVISSTKVGTNSLIIAKAWYKENLKDINSIKLPETFKTSLELLHFTQRLLKVSKVMVIKNQEIKTIVNDGIKIIKKHHTLMNSKIRIMLNEIETNL